MCNLCTVIGVDSGVGLRTDKCKRKQSNCSDNGKGDWKFRAGRCVAFVSDYKTHEYERDLSVQCAREETEPDNYV